MAERIHIRRFRKIGPKFLMVFQDGSSAEWGSRKVLRQYIDEGPHKKGDDRMRRLLRQIRAADPNFDNIANMDDKTYEEPDIVEVP